MPFEIDTGSRDFDPIPDWFRDMKIEAGTADDEARTLHDYGLHLIGSIRKYRSAKGARDFFWKNQAALRLVSEAHPEIFDEFVCTYAETLLAD